MKRLTGRPGRVGVLGALLAAAVLLAACSVQGETPGKDAASTTPTAPSSAAPPNPKHSLDLARKFAPLVRLGAEERYLPTDADAFISVAQLKWNRDVGCPDDLVDGDPAGTKLSDPKAYHTKKTVRIATNCLRVGRDYASTENTRPYNVKELGAEGYYLQVDESAKTMGSTDAPVYVQYVDGVDAEQGMTGYVYWFFFPWNQWTNPAGGHGGNHQGDWERVSVVADRADQPVAMVFSQHLTKCRMDWKDVVGQDDRPVAYSARGSHGSYPIGDARYPLEGALGKLGVIDDQTSTTGPQWRTWQRLREVTEQSWWGYGGGWGKPGTAAPVLGKLQTGPAGPGPGKNMYNEVFTDQPCPQPRSDAAEQEPSAPPAPPEPQEPSPAADTKEGAIARYEEYLHALGNEDIDTVCEIAGPAAKQAQRQGFGPCQVTFRITFQLIPEAKKAALRDATVAPGLVRPAAGGYEIPAAAVRGDATFSDSELGDSVLKFIDGAWYVVD